MNMVSPPFIFIKIDLSFGEPVESNIVHVAQIALIVQRMVMINLSAKSFERGSWKNYLHRM